MASPFFHFPGVPWGLSSRAARNVLDVLPAEESRGALVEQERMNPEAATKLKLYDGTRRLHALKPPCSRTSLPSMVRPAFGDTTSMKSSTDLHNVFLSIYTWCASTPCRI